MNSILSKCGRVSFGAILATVTFLWGASGAWALQPVNDNFVNRISLSGSNVTTGGFNTGATQEAGEPGSPWSSPVRGVWWTWTATGSGSTEINCAGSSYDTTLHIYTGGAVNALSLIVENDDAIGLQSRVFFTASAGTTYQIRVAGFGNGQGNITLNIIGIAGSPLNDQFANRTTIAAGGATVTGPNVGATAEAGEPNPAGVSGSASVWWNWTPTGPGMLRIDTFGSGFNTTLGVYTGAAVNALALVAQNDDTGGAQSQVAFPTTGGIPYVILVNGNGAATGSVSLTATVLTPTQGIVAVRAHVDACVTAGQITAAFGGTLNHVLACASLRVSQGQPSAAISLLRSFLLYVQRSTLPAVEKTAFTNEANALIAQLSAP